MLKLAIVGIVGLITIISFILIIRNKPEFWFWIFLNLFFDPAGYIEMYRDGKLVGPLNVTDVLIVAIVLCLIFAKINWRIIFADQFFLKFLIYLFIFSAYYFIIYGGVVPYIKDDFDYSTFFMKNRVFVYGIVILISVYVFSLTNLKYFYPITLFIGVICLTLYLITLLTGLPLVPLGILQREGTEMTRIYMANYGLFLLMYPLALAVYLLSRKINVVLKYKPWLYFGGVVYIVAELITLTRRTQIDIIGTTIIIVLIISYLFQLGKITAMFKLVIPAILVILVLYFTLPNYAGYITETAEDTFLLITTGKDSRGMSDQRVAGTGDLDITKEYIINNLIFGTGYTHLYWMGPGNVMSPRGKTFAIATDAANEVPIYYALFGFGIAGALLLFPLYFLLGKLFFKLSKLLKIMLINYLQDPITLIFSIYILSIIAAMFTLNIYALSSHFTGVKFSYYAVFMGIGFALYHKMYTNINSQQSRAVLN
ncbi:MAG: hypothetical protein IH595_10005 [Bacteroidales bacterium]|nr:hypothetical protein [Bacteroidales bacterium]